MAAQRVGLVSLERIWIPLDACGQRIRFEYATCGKFLNPEGKSCGCKNIRIHVDRA